MCPHIYKYMLYNLPFLFNSHSSAWSLTSQPCQMLMSTSLLGLHLTGLAVIFREVLNNNNGIDTGRNWNEKRDNGEKVYALRL